MRVRKRRHRTEREHRRFKPVAARGTVLDHKPRIHFAQPAEHAVGAEHLAAQPFARGIRVVAAEADGFVVVDLDIAEAVPLQHLHDLLLQDGFRLRVVQIPEMAIRKDRNSVEGQMMLFV